MLLDVLLCLRLVVGVADLCWWFVAGGLCFDCSVGLMFVLWVFVKWSALFWRCLVLCACLVWVVWVVCY